jgi:hypothetical protein
MSPTLLDALGCPYCGGLLFKESYYVRCERDHRFRSTLQRDPPPNDAAAGSEGDEVSRVRALQLRVIWHADRKEVGRVFLFPLAEE